MKRQIIFRGKDKSTGKWVFGDLVHNKKVTETGLEDRVMIDGYEVDEDTIGQYTGLKDNNNRGIYEGDILLYSNTIMDTVVFEFGSFGYWVNKDRDFVSFAGNHNFGFNPLNRSDKHEIIGNIYDNLELLKSGIPEKPNNHLYNN